MSEQTAATDESRDWIERLRHIRHLLGWSQRRVAKEFHVTPGAVSQWESGQRTIPGPVRRLIEVYEGNLGMIDAPGAQDKINSSWVARTLRSSGTAMRALSRLAGSSLRSLLVSNARATEIKAATQRAIGQQFAESLGELKGLMMKLGQQASYLHFLFPEEARAQLRRLQDDVPGMSPGTVNSVFIQSMGELPDRVFAQWEAAPFAAASIGQVHRAVLPTGEAVAVKVQYPHIVDSIVSDMTNARAMHAVLGTVLRGQDRGTMVAELRDRILEECDYELEASNTEEFRQLFAQTPGISIPRVYSAFSRREILTTEYVEGQRFAEFVADADQASKDAAGGRIFRFAFESIFRHEVFNADPHPGNYLFKDGGEVVFLDFGCVKRFPPGFIERWRRYVSAVRGDRRDEADAIVSEMGFTPKPEKFNFDYQHEMVRLFQEPWLSELPFRFNRHYVEKCFKVSVVDNPNTTFGNMPKDFLLTNRLQYGLYSVLADLDAQADWRGIIEDILPG